jgi:hypothetical protein
MDSLERFHESIDGFRSLMEAKVHPHHIGNPKWVNPRLKHETGEIKRTAKEFGLDHKKLTDAVKKGKPTHLPKHIWKKLDNTDSWDTKTPKHADAYAEKNADDKVPERLASVRRAFQRGSKLPSPIVLKHPKGHYLVGGNTRLVAARAHKVIPKVLMIDASKGFEKH